MDEDTELEELIICPMECSRCTAPGDCEDCLDCLHWPDPVPERVPAPATGRSLPAMASELAAARRELDLATRIGLVVRRYRRDHGLSQRDLALEIGLSKSGVARAESGATGMSVGQVQTLLSRTGHRLAIVPESDGRTLFPGEVRDTAWGATELLARDARGRRPPAASEVLRRTEIDRRLGVGRAKAAVPWTWSLTPAWRSPPGAGPPPDTPSSARTRRSAHPNGCP